ncbi:MAG: zf-HC2 domain-containing protein [Thermodesulfobacteriota bacterium]|nr:zf-HC2 domain-containing protein [Thermodesulfobacteriota bacterium]
MKCAGIKPFLSEYIDGVLDAQTKADIEKHISTCTKCRQEVEELKALVEDLGNLEKAKAPDDFMDRLHERIEPRFGFGKMIKKLFVPMRIKIPLQLVTATATAVLVFSIIHLQKPERQFPQELVKNEAMVAEKEEVKPEPMKEPAEPFLEKKIDTAKSASPKAVAHKKTETKKVKGLVSKRLKTKKVIELALALKTGTHQKPDLKIAPIKAAPPVESNKVHDEEEKAGTGASLRSRMAGKVAIREEAVADAVEKDQEPLPAQPSVVKSDSVEPEAEVENITAKLKNIAKQIKGKIQSVEYDHKTGHAIFVRVLIPAEGYTVFYDELKKMGVLHGPLPDADEKEKEMIEIRLVISK